MDHSPPSLTIPCLNITPHILTHPDRAPYLKLSVIEFHNWYDITQAFHYAMFFVKPNIHKTFCAEYKIRLNIGLRKKTKLDNLQHKIWNGLM